MKVCKITSPDVFHSIEKMAKSYATAERAEKAVEDKIGEWDCFGKTFCTVVPVARKDGRFVPVCFFQGEEAVQACINTAQNGFLSFA